MRGHHGRIFILAFTGITGGWATTSSASAGSYCDQVGPVVTVVHNGALQMRVLRCDGTAWTADVDGGWTLFDFVKPTLPSQVTVFDIMYWDSFKILTKQGHAWYYRNGAWIDGGAIPPTAPVAIGEKTWSAAKALFKK